MRDKIRLIKRLAILASELDRACDYPMADAADDLMEDLCCDVMNEKEVVIIPLKKKDQKMDDGRFGLNDPKHPTVKAAALSKDKADEFIATLTLKSLDLIATELRSENFDKIKDKGYASVKISAEEFKKLFFQALDLYGTYESEKQMFLKKLPERVDGATWTLFKEGDTYTMEIGESNAPELL